ncbi:exodeoxyribonuclease V subunit alpha [Acinetobacter indicus]|uniref:exodeoxyribonuclease V subunit alpha n=1 Tax=Acinetobacter indicus TaxID=756892 RepID=UPI001444226A
MDNQRTVLTATPETQTPAWFALWSNYLLQAPFFQAEKHEDSAKIIAQLLEATLNGDSCIAASAEQVAALANLVGSGSEPGSVAPFIYDQQHLYLYRYWALESALAQQVARLKQQAVTAVDVSDYLHLLEDQHQQQALKMTATTAFNLITGGPGTGKTYTLARIIAVLNQALPEIRIAMAAPTGKAAQRMKEALQNSFDDPKIANLVSDDLKRLTPITIHRLLGLGNRQQPRFHARQPLPYDLIVIDEASMLDLNLASMLFNAIAEQTRVILLGDAQQLASVDVGSVLADLQQVPALADNHVHLVTSRRFKAGALIGEMARFIQQQTAEQPAAQILQQFAAQLVQPGELQAVTLTQDMADVLQLEYLPDEAPDPVAGQGYYDKLMLGYQDYVYSLKQYLQADDPDSVVMQVVKAFDQYRILTAIRHGGLGLQQLNMQIEQRLLQQLALDVAKQGDWYVGRPVMMTYNDYQLGLSNGDIGLCLQRLREGNRQFEVYFPSLDKWVPATRLPKNIETAFALTIHKSQGSEFQHVAVVLDQAAQNLLSKELIYTAITRAKSVVSLLADRQALVQALTVKTSRNSGVLEKVNEHLSL